MGGPFGDCPECWRIKKELIPLKVRLEKEEGGHLYQQPYCPECKYKSPRPTE